MWLVIGFAIIGVVILTIFNIHEKEKLVARYFMGILVGILLGMLCGMIISGIGSLICYGVSESYKGETQDYVLVSSEIDSKDYYALLNNENNNTLEYSVQYVDSNGSIVNENIQGKIVTLFDEKCKRPILQDTTYSLKDYLAPWFFAKETHSYVMILSSPEEIYINSQTD